MKTMTCKQLGGACDKTFTDNTFQGMAAQSQQHGQQMAEQADEPHLQAMTAMKPLMADPKAMQRWMDEREQEFNETPEDD